MKRHNNQFAARFFKVIFEQTSIRDCCEAINAHSHTIYTYDKRQLLNMLIDVFLEYNHQEAVNHIESFCKRFDLSDDRLDFFDVLFDFSDNIIVRFENNFCFDYNYADIWRIIAKEIGEESFVISGILQNDLRRKYNNRTDMGWAFNIEHDNFELKKLLRRGEGVSENHFHLRVSSPYFDTSWVYLMNDISNIKYEQKLNEIEENRLNQQNNIRDDYSLIVMWRKAASIRLLLYMIISLDKPKNLFTINQTKLDEYYKIVYKKVIPYEHQHVCSFPITETEQHFSALNISNELDYAANFQGNFNKKYRAFSGERHLIYNCLKKILYKENGFGIIKELLYLYLIIKHRFYSEMVQSNNRIGFYNFAEFQLRKDTIITWDSEEDVATDTICSVIENNKIHRVELRISPQDKAIENVEQIELYDRAIKRAIEYSNAEGVLSKDINFFYTLHFPKKAETAKTYQQGFYRSQNLRENLIIKARAIEELRSNPAIASRVYGIDACAAEIDCRPEVFGCVFRRLKDFDEHNNTPKIPQLKATYHVGEDNYDIVDGIRAIDEAITFLNLRSGCRLGHATFLGLDPFEFYKSKNPVSMPKQNFLDNIVWMYYFIRRYSICFDELPNLISYIENQFETYFHKIYSDDIQQYKIAKFLDNPKIRKQYFSNSNYETVSTEALKFNIDTYYLSYLLRGDDPELYKSGYYQQKGSWANEYRICNTLEKMRAARKSFEACYLYYIYHYSFNSVMIGMESTIEKLPDYFVKGVALVQQKLRQKISEMGIAIESNPTSNLYISPINSYAEHPISLFYDNGLSKNPGDVQLNVSINTDDKSLFSTSLSNEYAYLMFYLEHQTDSNGNRKFSRYEILNWLDEIRRMGNEQSFLH